MDGAPGDGRQADSSPLRLSLRVRNDEMARSDAGDHDLGGLHEGGGGLAFAELHLADSVGGDDGGDALRGAGVDLEDDLGEEAGEFDLDDGADDLVAAAGGAEALARGGGCLLYTSRCV